MNLKKITNNDGVMILIFTILALISTALQGHAQSSTSGSSATSGSNASVYSHNGSYSGAQINNYGSDTVRYSGSYKVKNVPSVSAAGIVTAHNCAQGISGGIGAVGGGISFGGTYIDRNCEIISQAAALNSLVGAKAAITHMAQIPAVCRTLRSTGQIAAGSTCPDDPKQRKSVSTKSKPTQTASAASAVGYTRCEKKEPNRVVIRYRSGANKEAAKAACLASLGY